MSSPTSKQTPLADDTSPGSSPPRTGSPLIAGSPPRKQSPLVSSSSPGTSPTGKQSPLVVGSSPGAKSPLRSPEAAKARRETQLAKLQRQVSKDSTGGPRFRRVGSDGSFRGRTDSSTSGLRRPSLGFGHANSIPFHLGALSQEEIDLDKVPWWSSQRLMLSVICFVGFFCLYSLRVNLSTAIVCMTKEIVDDDAANTTNANVAYNTNNSTSNGTNVQISLADAQQGPQSSVDAEGCSLVTGGRKLEGDFIWSKSLQGLILGAFFWGYTAMQIPSGILSDRFGARLTIACGMFPVAILTILSPFLAKGSPYLLLVGRALIGVGEAMMYPGMQSLWAKWSPPHERSRLVGFAFGGSQLGNALTFPFAGLLCAYGFDGGWPSVFYVTGIMTFVWCCVYVFFARNSPGENPRISAIERKYIEQSLGTYGQSVEEMLEQRKRNKPWKRIVTSGPVWAILIANACGNYGAYMLLTQMPTYMKEVLKFDIKSNGAFSMIPYLVFWLFIIGGGQIADIIITKEIFTVEKTRKVCCCAGMVIPAIFLVATGYMDCKHQVEAVVLLSLSMGFCGFQFSSFFINHGDIAPKYAGTVFGFTNMGASVPGILAPYIVGALTQNKSKEEWRLAFYIAAGVYVFGAVVYWILAKGEVLEWAKEEIEYDQREEFPLSEITEEHEHEEATDAMLNGDKPKVNFE